MATFEISVDGGFATDVDAFVGGTVAPDDTFEILTLMGVLL